ATRRGRTFEVKTTNVRRLSLSDTTVPGDKFVVTVDGQKVQMPDTNDLQPAGVTVEKVNGKWLDVDSKELSKRLATRPEKRGGLQGPIDDAFSRPFKVVKPTGSGWHPAIEKHTTAAVDQFAALWDRYFRGALPVVKAEEYEPYRPGHLVLFGD